MPSKRVACIGKSCISKHAGTKVVCKRGGIGVAPLTEPRPEGRGDRAVVELKLGVLMPSTEPRLEGRGDLEMARHEIVYTLGFNRAASRRKRR